MPRKPTPDKKALNVNETCVEMGMSRFMVHKYLTPSYFVGRHPFFYQKYLDDWRDNHHRGPEE